MIRWRKRAQATVLALVFLLMAACGKEERQQKAVFGKLYVTIPDGFAASTTPGLFLSENYPEDLSNIYIYSEEKTQDFEQTMQNGKEVFVQNLQEAYEKQYGESPEISVLSYTQTSLAGHSTWEIEVGYVLDGNLYLQLEYIIDADQTYYVAFSQVGEYDYVEPFKACMDSIEIHLN